MPALTLFGRISVVSLLFAIQAAAYAQPAGAAPQPSDSSIAATAPAIVPFKDSVQVPTPAPTGEQQGDLLMVQQRYQAALEVYSKVEPPTAALENKMGIAYQMLFDPKSAIRCYKESLKM